MGAVLSERKQCFSSEMRLPLGFPRDKYPWLGQHHAGVGRKMAIAFAEHFGIDIDRTGGGGSGGGGEELVMHRNPWQESRRNQKQKTVARQSALDDQGTD